MTDENVLATFRYSWTKFELFVLSLLLIIPVAVSIAYFGGGVNLGSAYPVIIGVCILAEVALFYIGRAKKRASAVTAHLVDGVLTVKGANLGMSNSMPLSEVGTVTWRDDSLNFILTNKGEGSTVKIPARLASDPALRAVLHSLEAEGVKITKDAREVLEYYSNR